jgi:hypothetical protein
MGDAKVRQALLWHWRHEMEAAETYRQLAEQETDARRRMMRSFDPPSRAA